MQRDFQLTYAQLGLLPAMFMAGLMVSCLVFNELCNYVNSFRLIGAIFISYLRWDWGLFAWLATP